MTSTSSRREMLKRAAVAGAVAWTAPVLVSSPALANGTATPKCAGDTLVCLRWVRFKDTPSTCGTFTMNSMKLFSSPCPCTTQTSQAGCFNVPTQITFMHTDGNTRLSTVLDADNGFIVHNVYPGVWTAQQLLRAVTSCLDRTGNKVWRECYYTIRFRIAAESSSCSTEVLQGFTTKTCTTILSGDPCGGVVSPIVSTCASS